MRKYTVRHNDREVDLISAYSYHQAKVIFTDIMKMKCIRIDNHRQYKLNFKGIFKGAGYYAENIFIEDGVIYDTIGNYTLKRPQSRISLIREAIAQHGGVESFPYFIRRKYVFSKKDLPKDLRGLKETELNCAIELGLININNPKSSSHK